MPKIIEVDALSKAVLTYNPDVILEAHKDEASRQVRLLMKWKDLHSKHDPEQMAEIFEELGLFDAVNTAVKYRKRIYNLNRKLLMEIDPKILSTLSEFKSSGTAEARKAWKDAVEERNVATDEQMKYCWRILKAFAFVKGQANIYLSMGKPDFDPFAEYEYDPEDL